MTSSVVVSDDDLDDGSVVTRGCVLCRVHLHVEHRELEVSRVRYNCQLDGQ